jgi:hypothetical protein
VRPLGYILENHGPAREVALSLLSKSLFAAIARRYLDG